MLSYWRRSQSESSLPMSSKCKPQRQCKLRCVLVRGVCHNVCPHTVMSLHGTGTLVHHAIAGLCVFFLTEKILTWLISSSSQTNLALCLVRRSSSMRGGLTNTTYGLNSDVYTRFIFCWNKRGLD